MGDGDGNMDDNELDLLHRRLINLSGLQDRILSRKAPRTRARRKNRVRKTTPSQRSPVMRPDFKVGDRLIWRGLPMRDEPSRRAVVIKVYRGLPSATDPGVPLMDVQF